MFHTNLRNRQLKVKYYFLFMVLIFLSGCTFLNMLPNSKRDKWYMEHAKNTKKLTIVREGMNRKEVIAKWGIPWKKASENVWIYKFPALTRQKIYLRFDDETVIKIWTDFDPNIYKWCDECILYDEKTGKIKR